MATCDFDHWGTDSVCAYCHCDPMTCAHDSIFNADCRNFLIVTLNVTDRCNDSCEHCWHKVTLDSMNNIPRKDLEKEDIDVLWEYLDNSKYSNYAIIYSFIGGEPTLRPDIIDYALQKAMESRGKCSARIYTNGVSGIDEMRFLKMKHRNIKLQVSLPVHSKVELVDTRYANIEKYIKLQNYMDIIFSLAITEGNIDDAINIIDYAKFQGIHEMSLAYDLRNIPLINPEATYKKLIEIFNHCKEIMDDTFCVTELDSGEPDGMLALFNENNFVVEYDSSRNFYITHFTNSDSIGDVYTGIDTEKIKKVFSSSPCIGCEYMKVCNVKYIPCFINNDLSYTSYESTCLYNRALFSVIKSK